MYEHLYSDWTREGYITELQKPEYQDRDGNVVGVDSDDRLGRMVRHQWLHPDRILMADEVGFNTNCSREKVDRTKKVGVHGETVKNVTGTDDVHFSCLCFTTMTGIPVLMVIIIGGNVRLTDRVVYGYDEYKPWIGPEDNTQELFQRNLGIGKRFIGAQPVS